MLNSTFKQTKQTKKCYFKGRDVVYTVSWRCYTGVCLQEDGGKYDATEHRSYVIYS